MTVPFIFKYGVDYLNGNEKLSEVHDPGTAIFTVALSVMVACKFLPHIKTYH